jgi:hypothetical protein
VSSNVVRSRRWRTLVKSDNYDVIAAIGPARKKISRERLPYATRGTCRHSMLEYLSDCLGNFYLNMPGYENILKLVLAECLRLARNVGMCNPAACLKLIIPA